MSNGTKSTWQMIQIPAVITVVITLLRLIGELQHWSPRFFNPDPGGQERSSGSFGWFRFLESILQ